MIYLNQRWSKLRYHAEQQRLWNSNKRFCVVPAGRRSGKCLAKDSRIYLSDGTVKNIQDIVVGDIVWSINDKYILEPKKVQHVFNNGIKPVIKITTNKNNVVCTYNHPFLINNKWTEASEIKNGDLVACIKEFKNQYEEDIQDDFYNEIDLDMLSFWIAEGSQCKIATKTDEMLDIVEDFCVRYNVELRKSISDDCSYRIVSGTRDGGQSISHPMRIFLEQYDLYDKNSKTKFIPEFIYKLEKDQISRFLSVFVGCDGCVNKKSYSQPFISIGLANEFMITQLSELFLRFGIKGIIRKKIHSKKSKITGKNFVNWEFKISEKESIIKFRNEIGTLGKEEQLHQCFINASNSLGTCNNYLPITYEDVLNNLEYEKIDRVVDFANCSPGGHNAILKDAPSELLKLLNGWRKRNKTRISTRAFKKLRKYLNDSFDNISGNDVDWEEVKKIEQLGNVKTYDLTIEDNNNFVTSGFVTHNTELAKRKLVIKAIEGTNFPRPSFFAAAPTRDQAKRIFWDDLKALVPKKLIKGKPKESDLIIEMVHGPTISVLGLDVAERIEGSPWDGGILDEYGNMKEKVWGENVRPALSDRLGWCWLIGVPEGRNHYYRTYLDAKNDTTGEWGAFHWFSSDILPEGEIESARNNLDELTYQQEYEGSFLNFQGRIYYKYDSNIHSRRLKYFKKEPLNLCFDFNVAPGVLAIVQEQELVYTVDNIIRSNKGSGVIDEVHITRDSNTERVCKQFLQDYGNHEGPVICYGDSTGGSKGSAKTKGSDWDIISDILREKFGTRLKFDYPKKNPPERTRINAMNSRLMSSTGIVRMLIDSTMARHVGEDLDGVQVKKDSSGEIDKKSHPELSHVSDALGYYVNRKFPVISEEHGLSKRRILGV